MPSTIAFASATEIAARIRNRELSATEVAEACLRGIDSKNSQTNSFTEVTHDLALEAAARCDAAGERGESLGPLHGVPVAIKDLFDLRAGIRSTFGSVPLRGFVPKQTVEYVRRLECAGAVIVGKTNAPEFGHKGVTDNFVSGATSTPFDLSRNSGGSSGGSAAAVAAGLVPLAQGTDGGGSIRIPSAWCGTFGFKPSFGRIPDAARPDSMASTSPFVSTGPIARSVQDAALMLAVMAGPDPRDPFSLPTASHGWTLDANLSGLDGKRIAFSPNLGIFPVDVEIVRAVENCSPVLEAAGAIVSRVDVDWPADQQELAALWMRVTGFMYLSSLETVRGWGVDLLEDHRDALTPAFRDMVVSAQALTVRDVLADRMLRTAVQDAVQDLLDEYDFIVSATVATSPVLNVPNGETIGPTTLNGIAVEPCIGWCLTYPFNFTGNPAASMPCGLTTGGLPIGLQIVGRQHADLDLLTACASFEQISPWMQTYPGLVQ